MEQRVEFCGRRYRGREFSSTADIGPKKIDAAKKIKKAS